MPNIKPLNKLVTKARTIRDHHRARHTPSGFAFALADSIDYLDQTHWSKVTSHNSMFLSPRYLRVLEDAGPENLPTFAERFGDDMRHRIPMLNLVVRALIHTIDDHEEPPERNPFK